jgi:hypothetical protein
MHGSAAGALRNLLSTAEPVGHNNGIRIGGAHCGQQHAFAQRL